MPAGLFMRRLNKRWTLGPLSGWVFVACLFAPTACSGDRGDRQQTSLATIRGGERLVWNQVAESTSQLRSLTFKLYIDGNESPFSTTRCDESTGPPVFECSGVLPPMPAGQHVLELVSVLGGTESDRSPRLLVIVASAATTISVPSNELSRRSALRASTICASEHQADCYHVQVIASDLGRVTALALLPDGRVMFIEDGRQVRLINRDSGSSAIALVAETARQLTGLAIDEQFQTSRSVFVAWTEPAGDAPRLSITRYRELADVLGEGATIVTGLPASSDQVTPLALDDGLVYVAVPVDRSRSAPRFIGGAGAVLRFDSDGRVPPTNQHGSPIVAEGYPGPLALAIDRSRRKVWLTGRDYAQLGDIAAFEIPGLVRGAWPGRPVDVGAFQAESEGIDSIAVIKRAERADSEVRLLVAASGRVRGISLTANGDLKEALEIPVGDGYYAQSVAVGDDGALYVSVSTRNGSFSVLKLTRQRN